MLKLMVAGHGRHGKDTVCEILRDDFGHTFQSSSEAASDIFLYDTLKGIIGYRTSQECYEDRHNFRELWFELIKAYNHRDLTALGRKIFDRNSIYCGIRNREEFLALKEAGVFDVSIWVDGSKRHPPEGEGSCTVTADDMDIILDNNGTLEELKEEIHHVYATLSSRYGRDDFGKACGHSASAETTGEEGDQGTGDEGGRDSEHPRNPRR